MGSGNPTSSRSHRSLIRANAQMPWTVRSPALTPHITTVRISPSECSTFQSWRLSSISSKKHSFMRTFYHIARDRAAPSAEGASLPTYRRSSRRDDGLRMSHVNGYARASLMDDDSHPCRTPYERFAFEYGEEIARRLGIVPIPLREVTLRPELLEVR